MLSNQQIGQNLQEIRKSIRPKINAATFYNQYLKLIPGMPEASTEAAAAKLMSNIESGERQLPAAAYSVYSEIGGVSIDWILSGHDFHPSAQILTYADALRSLAILAASGAAQIEQEGNRVIITDYVLQRLLKAFQVARGDAVALNSPDRIEQWLSYVLEQLDRSQLQPEQAQAVQKFHAWLLQSYADQIQEGQRSDFSLLLDALRTVSK